MDHGAAYFPHTGLHETKAQFDHFFRRYPDYGSHQAGYCINAGLEWLVDWMQDARFTDDDLAHMRTVTDSHGNRLFHDDFLDWLAVHGTFDGLTLRAVPEGRVVHPQAPLSIVEGPLILAQLLETSLLNHLNYQTLIATKAARMVEAGGGRPVLEFGLRRRREKGGQCGRTGSVDRRGGFFLQRRYFIPHGVAAQRHARPQHGATLYGAGRRRIGRLPRLCRCVSR
ncbi:MAG: hypothetical protein R2911_26165 [Caldilineaceae bacterium]